MEEGRKRVRKGGARKGRKDGDHTHKTKEVGIITGSGFIQNYCMLNILRIEKMRVREYQLHVQRHCVCTCTSSIQTHLQRPMLRDRLKGISFSQFLHPAASPGLVSPLPKPPCPHRAPLTGGRGAQQLEMALFRNILRPTAVDPFFTASCAYSTWKRCPSGEKTVSALSYFPLMIAFFAQNRVYTLHMGWICLNSKLHGNMECRRRI